MGDPKDDSSIPELPARIDRRALERAALAHYSDLDLISRMPNAWLVTYGKTAKGRLVVQAFRKVFGAPRADSEIFEISFEELARFRAQPKSPGKANVKDDVEDDEADEADEAEDDEADDDGEEADAIEAAPDVGDDPDEGADADEAADD